MATQFSTHPVAAQPGPYQQHAYKSSMNYPMQSGHNTPVNISPTSPRSTANLALHPNNAPQIRPRQQPIYVPAALRRTEKPVRQSPPKVDSAVETPSSSWSFGAGFPQSPGEGMLGGIARIATEDLHTLNNDIPLSPVSGPITRNHWKPDSSTNTCSASACHAPFTFFNRRHHCRKCGGIFCWQHSSKRVKLNEHALFHPEGDLERACDRCYGQFREWQQLRTSRANSESSGSTGALPVNTPVSAQRLETHRVGSLASSVQGAFNWSTF